jgi:hypothetical protein
MLGTRPTGSLLHSYVNPGIPIPERRGLTGQPSRSFNGLIRVPHADIGSDTIRIAATPTTLGTTDLQFLPRKRENT